MHHGTAHAVYGAGLNRLAVATDADIDDPLIYASIAGGFVVAYPFAFLTNRHLIARGRGHALVHEHHRREHQI